MGEIIVILFASNQELSLPEYNHLTNMKGENGLDLQKNSNSSSASASPQFPAAKTLTLGSTNAKEFRKKMAMKVL